MLRIDTILCGNMLCDRSGHDDGDSVVGGKEIDQPGQEKGPQLAALRPPDLPGNGVSQPFYALLNAKISATIGRLTWEAWGKNLTNTDYLTYYFKSSAGYGQKGRPISFGTSLILDL